MAGSGGRGIVLGRVLALCSRPGGRWEDGIQSPVSRGNGATFKAGACTLCAVRRKSMHYLSVWAQRVGGSRCCESAKYDRKSGRVLVELNYLSLPVSSAVVPAEGCLGGPVTMTIGVGWITAARVKELSALVRGTLLSG